MFSSDEDVIAESFMEDGYEDLIYLKLNENSEKGKVQQKASRRGKAQNIERGHSEGHDKIFAYYLCIDPVYTEMFQSRFRMPSSMFKRITNDLEAHYPYFQRKFDACGKLGLSCIQKCTSFLLHLCYGGSADATDEYVRIGESSVRKALVNFCDRIINLYRD